MADRLPTDVVEARLNHLIDRARRGALLPEEADRFTTELRDLVRRLEDTEDERDRLAAGQCTHALDTSAVEPPPAPALTVEELRGGFWPDMTGGLCSVCHINLNRGAEKPDPGHPECVAAFDTPAAEATAGTVPVPAEAFAALVKVAAHVSVGRQAAFLSRYPDAAARRALGALDDAGLLATVARAQSLASVGDDAPDPLA